VRQALSLPATRRGLGVGSLALALALPACGAPVSTETVDVESTTTTSAPAETSTTTDPVVALDSATPELPAVIELPTNALNLEPGVYTTDRFVVPVTVTVDEPGWQSFDPRAEWVVLRWFEPGESTGSVVLMLGAYRPSESVDDLVESITGREGITPLDEPQDVTIGGLPGVVFDVFGEKDPAWRNVGPGGDDTGGCTIKPSPQLPALAGYELIPGPGGNIFEGFGIPACFRSRVWLVSVGGSTVTMIAVARDQERHEEMMAVVDGLLVATTFE
jgi:hypothetical protein